jgi:uncharacterized protein (TIRG00374 family)
MPDRTKKLGFFKNVFSIFIVILGICYLYKYQDQLSLLKSVNLLSFFLLLVYGFFSYLIIALAFKYQIRIFNIKLPFREWFGLTATNTMYNYFLPARGGFLARAYYLKKKYGFEYSKYISLLSGALLIGFLISSFSAVMSLIMIFFIYGAVYVQLLYLSLALFIGTFMGILIFWFLPTNFIKYPSRRLTDFFFNIIKGLQYFQNSKKTLALVMSIHFVTILFFGLRLYFAFLALGVEVNFLYIVVVQSLVAFTMVVSLTPGNLGIKEGIIGMLATMMDIPLSDAIMAAAIDRSVAMVIVFIFGGIYHFVLLREPLKKVL